ncbi:rifampicin phosphotransferase-like isoform X2 [Tribolium castaneum]|uniref:rifampicin phosphotransferase-like isoform X2 n=1 Tax=Tribolium castaneum TaxID=7070 RepID=UPI00077D98A7|nr:PREDICTED: putative phosphoenolpyruvate synthase isoform X2 [Tribolium castaneum]|eukprot:XP_015836216.1 PREDICTED: putative phosphoenolpyruvate synthase isoform X2 [Tribolium castaneum]
MELLLNFCYYVTLFLIPISLYVLVFQHRTKNRFYTNRDWFYIIKFLIAKSAVKKHQNKFKTKINITESPIEIRTENYCDNYFIYGADQKGNSLSLRFIIGSGLVGEVFLCLRLSTGAIYTFPGEKKTKQYNLSDWHWKTKDLHLEILEPFKRHRVTFNGLLSNATNDIEHVRFNLTWIATNAPRFHPQDAATDLLTNALAQHPWRDGDWLSLLGDECGYEQFGALHGFIRGDSFKDDFFVNLPSCRTRFWGTAEKLAVSKCLHLFVAGHDGTLISIWVKSLKHGCHGLQYGNVVMTNGTIQPITASDIRFDCLGQNSQLPETFLIHIYALKQTFRIVFHTNTIKTIVDGHDLSNIPADCDLNTQQGKSLVELWQGVKNTSRDKPLKPLLIENKSKTLPTCYVISLDDESAKIVNLSGGKGCSLAMLTCLKSDDFIVPNGFIITVNAFNKQLEMNFNMKKAVSILDDICCGRSLGDLEHACAQTIKTFESEKIIPEVASVILQAFRNLKPRPTDRFAVRSSAIGEDSEDLSAAGQNSTFLGCSTFASILQSVSACWASLYTNQSVRYRHKHGIAIPSQMAVVVQKMVQADCAGVLFTCHPSTGNPAHIVITANHGLGESVVSGRSEPDTIILERTFDNDVTIQSKTLGLKNKIVKMTTDGEGVVECDGLQGFSLTDNQALVLGRVGVALEEKMGGARDIEWAFSQGRLYLLQARPITTLNLWTDYELLHEFDVATLSDDVVYTVANTGEILPGAISTLTLSTVVKAIDKSIQISVEGHSNEYSLKCLGTFQGHLFVDVITGIHRRVKNKIELISKIVDLAIFGHPIINEKIHYLSLNRFGPIGSLEQFKELYTMIKLAWCNEKNAKMSKTINETYQVGIDTTRDTLKDIYNKIDKSLNKMAEVLLLHCYTTRTSVSYQIFAMTVLAENAQDFTIDHYNDIAMLLASCDEVISAEIPNTLANITRILNENHQNMKFAEIDPNLGRKWLKDNSPEASKIFEQFIKNHGHRALREFDIFNETWGTNPVEVIKMIQTNCRSKSPKQEKTIKPIDEVIAGLVSPTKTSTRKFLKFLMNKSRRAVGLREQTKSESIRFVDKLRQSYRILGQKMAFQGLIPEPDLIFHLSHYEIGQILDKSDRNPIIITKYFFSTQTPEIVPKMGPIEIPRNFLWDPLARNSRFYSSKRLWNSQM